MEKLWCYVDETGQHTSGDIFVVAVVTAKEGREQMYAAAQEAELTSGKHLVKWMKTDVKVKEKYLRAVFADVAFTDRIFFSKAHGTRDYRAGTLLAIASAITAASDGSPVKAVVVIDGLKRNEQEAIGTGLRRIGISTAKVRGVADEGDALIRLADAVAGLAREAEEGRSYATNLLGLGKRRGTVRQTDSLIGG